MPDSPSQVERAVHSTLSGAEVHEVIITDGDFRAVEVKNRHATEWLTVVCARGSAPTDPTVAGENTDYIEPGERIRIDVPGHGTDIHVKLLGLGNPFSLVAIP